MSRSGDKKRITKEHYESFGVKDTFIMLIKVTVSQVNTHVKIHEIVHFKFKICASIGCLKKKKKGKKDRNKLGAWGSFNIPKDFPSECRRGLSEGRKREGP